MSTVINDKIDERAAAESKHGILHRGLRQPLLQFLFIGGVIFAASMMIERSRDSAAHTVLVDSARVQRLAELYRVQMGAMPSPADLDYLVESHIRDEILYREALRIGLERDDEIIRRRVIQKMEFLQNDLAPTAQPSEEELRQYHANHSEEFATAATVDFTHIYFSTDVSGEEGAKREAQMQLARMSSSDDVSAAHSGDPFPLQRSYADVDAQETAQFFGRTPFTEAVFTAPQRRWSGPFRSGYGWHLIFISKRDPSVVMDFATTRERVREMYLMQKSRDANERKYAALKARYRVLRTAGEPAQ